MDVRYAFLFPDTYEVGMSHLGMKILYHAINAREDALCERVFSPWVDMAALMRAENMPLFTLESRTPVREFDLLGITLQYEMSFSNILEALDLAGIPLRSAERASGPFVICGGPAPSTRNRSRRLSICSCLATARSPPIRPSRSTSSGRPRACRAKNICAWRRGSPASMCPRFTM